MVSKFLTLTVDAVCFRADGAVLLIQRSNDPYAGKWALPGGKVEMDECLEEACLRELFEEKGLSGRVSAFVGVYAAPERDPRGRWVSLSFLVSVASNQLKAGSDASNVKWKKQWQTDDLAFDHLNIISDAYSLAMSI